MTAMHQPTGQPRPAAPVPPPAQPDGTADADELAQLRAEVSALRMRLDGNRRRGVAIATTRRIAAAVLVAITAFGLVSSVVGGWAAYTALNTDRWVATIAPLPQNRQVSAAVSDYATNQVFAAIDVEQRLREVLPQQATFVAVPVASQLRDTVRETVDDVLRSEQFQAIWLELNRRAHQRALAIINGSSDIVVARQDRVDIDLLPLINQVLRALSVQLPTLFGKQLTLPDLTSGEIPGDLRVRVQDALGVTLPSNFAQFTVYDSGQLWAAQQAVATAKRDLVLFVVGTFVLLLAALLISPTRRRTLLQLGLWLVLAAVAVSAVLRTVRFQILNEVPAGLYRDGVAAALTTVFRLLRVRGEQLIWIGVVLALAMYLIGPGRGPTWLRRHLRVAARAALRAASAGGHRIAARGPGWVARYLDVLRVGGVVVAAVLALLLSSWTALLVIAVALAVFELFVTVVAMAAAHRGAAPPTTGTGGAGTGGVASFGARPA